MSRVLTLAALQSAYGPDQDANIGRTIELVREAAAAGAQVVLPPELFQSLYFRAAGRALVCRRSSLGQRIPV